MRRFRAGWLVSSLLVPLASVVAGFLVGALAIVAAGADPLQAYGALFAGAFTNRNAFAETLVSTVPYVLLGLGLALGFRAGLFNIGAEGQFYIGALTGVFVGYSIHGLPLLIEIPAALLAGMAGGFAWAAIAGFLKAWTGAHEVITSIMLNYVAFLVANYLIDGANGKPGVMVAPNVSTPRTPDVDLGAMLPIIVPGSRLHLGLLLALIAVPLVWFLIERTTVGFRLRAVGFNQGTARAAGISVAQTIVLTMGISGALAGAAGIVQVLGLSHHMTDTVAAGYGFDAIAIALLARSNPWGVLPAALLFGALHNGAGFMQLETQVSSDLISIVQASLIIFVAAPAIVRWLLRLREQPVETVQITQREVETPVG
ncbi:MAG: ABC transporter permease [Chloroflexi bacterium]|nr:MAG: ABC transporter permease [Chloroflexota bacterium]TME17580.1 MAG: ABC transporter permease [Chloroflexota bacterium]